jgi:hypothetical protein
MAYAILKGLGAQRHVSSVTIDATRGKVLATDGCAISDEDVKADHIQFDRLDQGLPFNQGLFFNLRYRFIPLPEEMNRYMLTVTNLNAGEYEIAADNRKLGKFSADALSKGVNLASATADGWEPGGPWDAQAWTLNHLTEARNELAESGRKQNHYLKDAANNAELFEQLDDLNERLETAQRLAARPPKCRFVIRAIQTKK